MGKMMYDTIFPLRPDANSSRKGLVGGKIFGLRNERILNVSQGGVIFAFIVEQTLFSFSKKKLPFFKRMLHTNKLSTMFFYQRGN